MNGTLHVVGAGLAGLSAATAAAERGRRVVVYEAAAYAGGRCRSFHDRRLGATIDNGNHLLLSGNTTAAAYLARTGARGRLRTLERARFPFMDLATGNSWTVDFGRGRLPLWLFSRRNRVPDTRPRDYLGALDLLTAGPDARVEARLGHCGALYRRFWEPLARAVLNTEPSRAAAALLAPVIRETFGRGGRACRPMFADHGLGHALVEPALAYLAARGAEVHFGARLRQLEPRANAPPVLRFADRDVEPRAGDRVVLAVPAWSAAALLPGLTVPDQHRAIVNAHFALPGRARRGNGSFVGLVGGTAEWLFLRERLASVTISAADREAARPAEQLAGRIWRDIAPLVDAGTGMDIDMKRPPPCRIIKERRATFAQTPEQVRKRPGAAAGPFGLALAGDWTDTGLPATIEGALRSGELAVNALLSAAG